MDLPPAIHAAAMEFIEAYKVPKWSLTGSREICPEAATSQSDWDVLCHTPQLPEVYQPYADQMDFFSKKIETADGVLNILGTESLEFYQRFTSATRAAKALKLIHKKDRVTLFQAVLYAR